MDKDPKIQELAFSVIEKLAEGLLSSIKEARKLKEGQRQEWDNSPAHIIGELQRFASFL